MNGGDLKNGATWCHGALPNMWWAVLQTHRRQFGKRSISWGAITKKRIPESYLSSALVSVVPLVASSTNHAFTGCDSASAFASKGKRGSLKLTKKVAAYWETISDLAKTWKAYTDDLLQRLELFTCHLCIKWVTERCQLLPVSACEEGKLSSLHMASITGMWARCSFDYVDHGSTTCDGGGLEWRLSGWLVHQHQQPSWS